MIWNPTSRATVRAAYSRSLGGFDLDQSVRIEPTQLAGFVQTYRGLFPDSVVGGVSGARMAAADLSLEYRFPSGTYAAVSGQLLRSRSDHEVGGFRRDLFTSAGPAIQLNERLRYQERSLEVSLHQLLGDMFAVGVRYRCSEARLSQAYPEIDPTLGTTSINSRGLMNSVRLDGIFRHSSGFFAGVDAEWWAQHLGADLAGTGGADFWQMNLMAGYRFPRRHAEITIGVLNVTGRDYRLHPVNLYPDLPRERTFFTRLQLNF